jgi:hypothetical protein
VVAPYVGARYLGIPTTEANLSIANAAAAVSYSQFGGVNYGVRAYTELPLGFNAYLNLGLTTLVSGGWDTRQNGLDITNAGRLDVGRTTMPSFGVGAGWNFYNMIALTFGYELFTLPTGLRAQGTSLAGAQTTFNTLTLGARILFVSF